MDLPSVSVNSVKVKRVSGGKWDWTTESLIDMYVGGGYIINGLLLTPSEREHSVAPSKIKITYSDGSWHEYSLAECYACGQDMPGGELNGG